jgi:hypothetical protein
VTVELEFGPAAPIANAHGRRFPHLNPDRDRSPDLDWLNMGVFISVGGRQAAGVIYETYVVA